MDTDLPAPKIADRAERVGQGVECNGECVQVAGLVLARWVHSAC